MLSGHREPLGGVMPPQEMIRENQPPAKEKRDIITMCNQTFQYLRNKLVIYDITKEDLEYFIKWRRICLVSILKVLTKQHGTHNLQGLIEKRLIGTRGRP